jgi:hypothetical protein
MPIPTWIRDALGIRKDFIETEKTVLEIAKLEDEQRERDFLIRASKADIEKYDPNTQLLLRTIAEDRLTRYGSHDGYEAEFDDGVKAAFDIVKRLGSEWF